MMSPLMEMQALSEVESDEEETNEKTKLLKQSER